MMDNWDKILNIVNNNELFENLDEDSIKYWNSLNLNEKDFDSLKRKSFEIGIEKIYDAMNLLYYEASIKEPSITFTPIAVYRQ